MSESQSAEPQEGMLLAAEMRKARMAQGKEQKDIAKSIGVDAGTISIWESESTTKLPGKARLEAVAKAYQLELHRVRSLWETDRAAGRKSNAIAEILKRARIQAGYSQDVIAEKLNVRRESVSQWERPRGNPPAPDKMEMLAELYHLDINELMSKRMKGDTTVRTQSTELSFRHGIRPNLQGYPLPCLPRLPDNLDALRATIIRALDFKTQHIYWRMVNMVCSERSFFLQMQGKSMEPRIPDLSWIAFDPDRKKPKVNDVILVRTSDNKTVIGQLAFDQKDRFLVAANPQFSTRSLPITHDSDIIAVAFEVQIPLISVS
ncbi:helix-turn-helix domain-containing protein [Acidithiobacillus thiooxidans]|uniref:XRE family transcriptional regulator n=1 Tax=Acidithiobacillus TaxID=119977 RepID=UPI0002624B15|nr:MULTISPECIES: XRE family transcriptional regulator [Acidithiobacillus]MBU2740258.1 helix-turn-helix domain-containing protein [Acidithiobacillus albertensis]MBU2811993.1 helix-turn-helix domain-containing protein [Acidithiobacillus thiooxidans]MBU2834278.1 helix-turn-helix domain-containing protein [Acidithiobacillus thiooxidans]